MKLKFARTDFKRANAPTLHPCRAHSICVGRFILARAYFLCVMSGVARAACAAAAAIHTALSHMSDGDASQLPSEDEKQNSVVNSHDNARSRIPGHIRFGYELL